MDKVKRQILLFVIIILIGVGYAINQYIITPKKLLIQQKAKQEQADKDKLNLLRKRSLEAAKLSAEVESLKQVAASIGDVTVTDINTPQLIFDFYSSCKKYSIKGEDLIFQLADSNAKAGNSSSGSTTPNTVTNTTTDKTTDTNKPTTTDFLKLTIELKVSGDKNKVETYIRSLNTLTSRKINVKSIKLEATIAPVFITNTPNTINPNTILPPVTKIPTQPLTDQVTADIIFYQYIYNNDKTIIRSNNYSFYNANVGFSSFSDMFK